MYFGFSLQIVYKYDIGRPGDLEKDWFKKNFIIGSKIIIRMKKMHGSYAYFGVKAWT